MTTPLVGTEKERIFLFEFEADGVVTKYTDWDTPFGDYTATPTIDLKISPITALLAETVHTITMPLDEMTAAISSGSPHAVVTVTVKELYRGSRPVILTTFIGEIGRAVRNAQGRKDRVKFEINNEKYRLKAAMGLPANHQCVWTFGDTKTCEYDAVAVRETGTLTVVDLTHVTISGLSVPPTVDATYWVRGRVIYEGVELTIRKWDEADAFHLVRRPPDSWDGQTVTVQPGCDKSRETCEDRWSNLLRFAGAGYAIPAYHPVIENP